MTKLHSYRAFGLAVVACVVGTLSPLGASAAVITSTSTESPTENVFLSTSTAGSGNVLFRNQNATWADARRDIGQTFLAPGVEETLLSSVVFQVASASAGALGTAFTLQIFEFENGTAFAPLGAAIYTGSGVFPTTLAADSYLRFDLDQSVSLQGGKTYGIQLGFVNQSSNSINLVTSNGYADGLTFKYYNPQGTTTPVYALQSTGDLRMHLVSIPEPGAPLLIGLLSLGGLAFTARGFRKAGVRATPTI